MNQVLTVVVPAGKIYIPKVTISTMNPAQNNYDLRYFGDDITPAIPRHYDSDPPGYSPITWLWDVTVPQDRLTPRAPSRVWVTSIRWPPRPAIRSTTTARSGPATTRSSVWLALSGNADCAGFDRQCNVLPDLDLATADLPPGKNIADLTIEREGGPRCDIPAVGYGQYCAPGIARCASHVPNSAGTGGQKSDWDLLQAMKIGAPGPNLAVHAPAAAAKTALDGGRPVQQAIIDNPASTPEQRTAAMGAIARLESTYATAQARATSYAEKGYATDLWPRVMPASRRPERPTSTAATATSAATAPPREAASPPATPPRTSACSRCRIRAWSTR